MNIAAMIGRVARGAHGAENLSQTDAELIFDALLYPDADPLQLGAFLIAQRMKGESGEELAGFVRAARRHVTGTATAPAHAVDLPCYAGKRRAAHACLAAAMQARDRGIPVFVHGVEAIEGRITAWQILSQAGVSRAGSMADAGEILLRDGIVYADLADICPDLFSIYQLRPRLGVRSFANTVARLLNPMRCAGQLNGLFHTPYADYMSTANRLLEQPRSLVFMGAEGEPELYADRQKLIVRQQGDRLEQVRFEPAGEEPYPRECMDLNELAQHSLDMLGGAMNARERAVVRRMGEAFSWAACGTPADDWSVEE
ncbi:anthranilate phosphoribosyltransferase [Mariprofundus erugo]|uniref:Anthranilate phosphoribosyltransferase n=1 Tax=Mariprofundus erugo TaxID=2528639 RepID=A0A5R9GG75_9PROT|nr:anthranilate phosphoribosyltransferase [Mariprofundus erugo]TLS65480.1 anthranilate phosphoribosyltransferase [Mariprofundus erugo]